MIWLHGTVCDFGMAAGGQKARLVLAAAMWSMPHMIALDEPTNYLDNDTLVA